MKSIIKKSQIILNVVTVFTLLFLLSCSNTETSYYSDSSIIQAEFHDANSKTVLVAAHRGAHNGNFENSIASIKKAIELGVDIVELDVKTTKDGYLILMHDSKIDRTTTGKGKVEDLTFAEIRSYKLTGLYGRVSEETVPTFEEALNAIKGKIMVDIDMKTDNVKGMIEMVEKTGTNDDVFYFDNDYHQLDAIIKLNSSSKLMPRAYSYKMADSAIVRYAPPVIHIDPKFYTKEVSKLLRENNSRVWINSLGETDAHIRYGNGEEVLKTLIGKGANVIQTDEPEMLLQLLRMKGLHD
ncbi:MAG: glycerophosphodiester phosphodiesterase family protein [Flavobacteriaceae bacterium]|nr:glycerophosphodiester phosphodiesterase family protein [Flavobacteriaceae bacterium]